MHSVCTGAATVRQGHHSSPYGSSFGLSTSFGRGRGYSQPILPGYVRTRTDTEFLQNSRGGHVGHASTGTAANGSIDPSDYIPILPVWLAVLCLVLNILLPGSGTFLAACSVMCSGVVCRPEEETPFRSLRVNLLISFVQFVLTIVFLLGWIWSISWGFSCLSLSRKSKAERARNNSQPAATTEATDTTEPNEVVNDSIANIATANSVKTHLAKDDQHLQKSHLRVLTHGDIYGRSHSLGNVHKPMIVPMGTSGGPIDVNRSDHGSSFNAAASATTSGRPTIVNVSAGHSADQRKPDVIITLRQAPAIPGPEDNLQRFNADPARKALTAAELSQTVAAIGTPTSLRTGDRILNPKNPRHQRVIIRRQSEQLAQMISQPDVLNQIVPILSPRRSIDDCDCSQRGQRKPAFI